MGESNLSALIRRVNRKLALVGKVAGKTPGHKRSRNHVEMYYVLDTNSGRNRYLTPADLENFARELDITAVSRRT